MQKTKRGWDFGGEGKERGKGGKREGGPATGRTGEREERRKRGATKERSAEEIGKRGWERREELSGWCVCD